MATKMGKSRSGVIYLSGSQEKVHVNPLTNVTGSTTTYEAFAANALEGEIGIFKASDNSRYTGAITVGDEIYIAQKRAGGKNGKLLIVKTPSFVASAKVATRSAYTAPTKQITTFGFNGTDGSLNLPTMVKDEDLSIALKETTAGIVPHQTTYNYSGTVGTDLSPYKALLQIVNRLNDELKPESGVRTFRGDLLYNAAASSTNSGNLFATSGTLSIVFTKNSKTFTIGHNATTATYNLAVGDFLRIDNETAEGTTFNTIVGAPGLADPVYRVTSIGTFSAGGNGSITVTLDREYQGETQTITDQTFIDRVEAASVGLSGANADKFGIRLVALDKFRSFAPFRYGLLVDATAKVVTPMTIGVGDGTQVYWAERNARAQQGYTTAYGSGYQNDLQQPEYYSSESETYDIVHIKPTRVSDSKTGIFSKDTFSKETITLCLKTGGTVSSQMATILTNLV